MTVVVGVLPRFVYDRGCESLTRLQVREQIFDFWVKLLFPENLSLLEQVGLWALDELDSAGLKITDVNAFSFIKRNGLSLVDDLNFDPRDEVQGSLDHPRLPRTVLLPRLRALHLLLGLEKQGLVILKHHDVLYAAVNFLARIEEELALSLS